LIDGGADVRADLAAQGSITVTGLLSIALISYVTTFTRE